MGQVYAQSEGYTSSGFLVSWKNERDLRDVQKKYCILRVLVMKRCVCEKETSEAMLFLTFLVYLDLTLQGEVFL